MFLKATNKLKEKAKMMEEEKKLDACSTTALQNHPVDVDEAYQIVGSKFAASKSLVKDIPGQPTCSQCSYRHARSIGSRDCPNIGHVA